MPTMSEVREKYPQYNDMSDDDLASALHQKFYSDMPITAFRAKVGLSADPVGLKKPVDVGQEISAIGSKASNIVIDALGAPVDAAWWLMKQLGAEQNEPRKLSDLITETPGKPKVPFGGSESIKRGLGAVGVRTDMEPQTTAGRIGSRVLGEIGSAAIPMTAAAQAARSFTQMGPVGRTVTSLLTEAPVAQTGVAATTGLGAGIGHEVGGETGEAIGALTGAVGGALGAGVAPTVGAITYNTGKSILEPFRESGRQAIVGRTMRRLAEEPETLGARLEDVTEIIPGSMPTTAQATGDRALLAAERGLASGDPRTGAAFERRAADQSAARVSALDEIPAMPTTDGSMADARTVAGYIASRADEFRGATDEIIQRAAQAAQARFNQLGDEIRPDVAGRVIREEYDKAYQAMRQQVRGAYEGVDPDGTATLDIGAIVQRADQSARTIFGPGSGGVPPEIDSILRELNEYGQNAPYAVLQRLRSRAGIIAKNASGADGDPRTATVAGDIRSAIDSQINRAAGAPAGIGDEGLPVGGFTPEQAAQYREAVRLRTEQGTRFEQGPSRLVGSTGSDGAERFGDSQVASAYFNSGSGGVEDARKFLETFGGDRSRAYDALRNYAATSLRDYAAREDGTINPTRWARWTSQHRDALRQFPELEADIGNAQRAQATLDRLIGRQARTLDQMERGAAGFFLKQNPDDAVASIIGSKNSERLMADLYNTVKGDAQASAGLRRAVIDNVLTKAQTTALDPNGAPVYSPGAMLKQIEKVRPLLRSAGFTPGHIATVQRVADDLVRANASNTAVRPIGSNTMQNLSTGNVIGQITAGLVDPNNSVLQTIAKPLKWLYSHPEIQVQDMLREAMLDPQLARQFLAKATPMQVQAVSKTLERRMLATAGIGALQSPQRLELAPIE